MPTHLALLRGINIGGRNKLAMADLRAIVESLGHTEVATYLQSGNVVFRSRRGESGRLADEIEAAIAVASPIRPLVVVLSRAELAEVVAANPFPEEANPKLLHVLFRRGAPPPEEILELTTALEQASQRGSRDEARIVGHTLFLRTPDGFAGSQLAARLTRPKAATTARNWSTVTALARLLRS